jgi:hypothetical protein
MQSFEHYRPALFEIPAAPPHGAGDGEASVLTLMPKLLVIFSVLTLVVNGALPQLEMAFTGGSLMFVPRQLSFLIIGLGSMLLLKARFQGSPLLPITVAVSSYFVVEALYLHMAKDISYGGIRTSLEAFIFLALVGIASTIPLQIRSKHVLALLLIMTAACLIVSAAQFLSNSPVVRTESNDSDFHVQSYQFLDQTRAFSLFTNGLEAGFFYSLMGGIATSLCLGRGTKWPGMFLLLLCAFGCYATYTRLAMVGFLVTVFSAFIISRKGFGGVRKLLPLVSLGCALLLIAQALHTAGGASRTDLASVSSLQQRLMAWGIYGNKFVAGSRTDILFGIGQGPYTPFTAPNRLENAAPIPIDNAYLLALLSSGVCGTLLLAVAYVYLWSYLLRKITLTNDHLITGIAGMFATLPFFCCINDLPAQMILLLIFVVCLRTEEPAAAFTELALKESTLPRLA